MELLGVLGHTPLALADGFDVVPGFVLARGSSNHLQQTAMKLLKQGMLSLWRVTIHHGLGPFQGYGDTSQFTALCNYFRTIVLHVDPNLS